MTEDEKALEEKILALLLEKGLEVLVAESSTGGLILKRLSDPTGASGAILGGVVAYNNRLKERLLDVSKNTMIQFGAVSEPTAHEMANGVYACDYAPGECIRTTPARGRLALAETGITGPGGGSAEKPVGLVWLALTNGVTTWVRAHNFNPDHDRASIRGGFAYAALKFLRDYLEGSVGRDDEYERYAV